MGKKINKFIYNKLLDMSRIIEVVYEGVFKPLQKVELKEGERLKVEIVEDISHLRGKYGRRKVDLQELRDEIYDRRSHLR
jgi:predicted DNA-binding antitoxin AbrB/MazE fold protein